VASQRRRAPQVAPQAAQSGVVGRSKLRDKPLAGMQVDAVGPSYTPPHLRFGGSTGGSDEADEAEYFRQMQVRPIPARVPPASCRAWRGGQAKRHAVPPVRDGIEEWGGSLWPMQHACCAVRPARTTPLRHVSAT
jgi:hypothetical protein